MESKALDPLEGLERVYPLIEDEARFASLYEQQRDLVNRLAALKGHDHQDNPREKARMRDLEAEQRRIHKALDELVDDIDDHLQQLPENEALDPLRKSAREFVEKVRGSGALEAMADAESGLAEFSGTLGHAGAEKAADALKKLLGKSQQIRGQGKSACLVFKPGLGDMLGDTIEQLLAESGLKPGKQGYGSGSKGLSNSGKNAGLYGQMPGGGQARGQRQRQAGKRGNVGSGRDGGQELVATHPDGSAVDKDTLQASGAGGMPVPVRHRSRVAAYLERILEEQTDDTNQP